MKKNHSYKHNLFQTLWETLNLKNTVSVSVHVRNSSFPSHQESCPPSSSSSTLPPVWSFWNTNVSKLLPCLHHFDIHPLLQCFQIEFKLSDIKDSHDLIPDFFTSFIFNYSSSPLPSKLLLTGCSFRLLRLSQALLLPGIPKLQTSKSSSSKSFPRSLAFLTLTSWGTGQRLHLLIPICSLTPTYMQPFTYEAVVSC